MAVDLEACAMMELELELYHEWELANCECGDAECNCDPTAAEVREWAKAR